MHMMMSINHPRVSNVSPSRKKCESSEYIEKLYFREDEYDMVIMVQLRQYLKFLSSLLNSFVIIHLFSTRPKRMELVLNYG